MGPGMRVIPPKDDREFQRVATRVRQAGAPFYFIAVDTDLNPGPSYAGPVPDLQQIRARLEQLADESGGQIVFPKNTQDVGPLFLQFARELGTSTAWPTPTHAREANITAWKFTFAVGIIRFISREKAIPETDARDERGNASAFYSVDDSAFHRCVHVSGRRRHSCGRTSGVGGFQRHRFHESRGHGLES